MKLGISSHAYGWAVGVPGHLPESPLTPGELVRRAGDLGVKVVQIADNMPLLALADDEIEGLGSVARERGVTIELGTRGISLQHVLPYLSLAQQLDAPLLRTITDTPGHEPDPGEIVRSIAQLVPHLERAGIVLGVENHDRLRSSELARIMQRVGSRTVGVCLDTVNSFGALEGPEVVVETLGPWTVNLHLKEFAIERFDHRMGFTVEGRPLGKGRLDVPWLLARLQDYGRDPNAILEQWTPFRDSLQSTVALESEWVRESVGYARQLITD